MFDLDKWQEIFATIQKNKLRTFLTAFGVFWGIFMLVLLLGAGNGMQNGVEKDFGNQANNSLWIWEGKTTMPHQGFKPGREIRFTEGDVAALQREIEGAEFVATRNRLRGEYTLNYKEKNGSFQVFGSNGEFFKINGEEFIKGRSINLFDIEKKRKIVVIGDRVREVLFGDSIQAIGEYIEIKGIHFRVVGIFKIDGGNGRREERAYIPFSTYQNTFNPKKTIDLLGIMVKDGYQANDVEKDVRKVLAQRHHFSAEDIQALGLNNNQEDFERFQGLFKGIRMFVWVVGVGTLIAGIVGVSNIMLIIVKERTREIGVRKALGATPWSIISLIIQESVVITAVAGYTGLFVGVALVEGINILLKTFEIEGDFFANPEVNFTVAMSATITLIITGTLAGLIPATKAARINPVEALRDE